MYDANPLRQYNLIKERQSQRAQTPFSHQHRALSQIQQWFASAPKSNAGGIVVLPTGGGKTFTAVRFLCTSVIAKGYKILWLAHTHHLLDQAFVAFEKSVGTIPEPKMSLCARVVSGTPPHDHIRRVEPTDDVVVATLQTITLAFQNDHPQLIAFLRAAGDRLCVVFDEAHHSPAPSYRKLLKAMRADHAPQMILIGLTATPTYSDPKKIGWLRELFPQGIIHQSKARDLLADGILARPSFEKISTKVSPEFDEIEYMKWVDTYRDLPEDIIEALASNRERNALIANHYVENREKYGRTIIFAERWFQCEQISSFLERNNVRVGSVYSRADAQPSTVEARNIRTADENRRTLEKFKTGELDVLLNVKMLTEGTDVPETKTVFITRQTTSTILLTQMVGRALRGPRAGGTKEAFIVSFEDNWKHKINWADFDQLTEGPIDDTEGDKRPKPPVRMISIDLVRRLADQMDSGINVAPTEFRKLMPIGWYRVEFQALVEGSEDIETVRLLIMVFEDQTEGYRLFLEHLQKIDLSTLSSERVTLADSEEMIRESIASFFPDQLDEISRVEDKDLFHLARDVAQNDGELPQFVPFGERELYDLDAVAQEHLDQDLSQRRIDETLKSEFQRRDRFWMALYPRYELFKTQYDACVNRILNGPTPTLPPPAPPYPREDREPSEDLKAQVKSRDGHRCLCCGEMKRSRLQVDHIAPWYFGGRHTLENLQTLCKICNRDKGTTTANYRIHRDHARAVPPSEFPPMQVPDGDGIGDTEQWAQSLRRAVNLFYGAAAVEHVNIGRKGRHFYEWSVQLFDGNQPSWLAPHLPQILNKIRFTRSDGGFKGPDGIRVIGSSGSEASHFSSNEAEDGRSRFLDIPSGTECRLTVGGKSHVGVVRNGQLKVGRRSPFNSLSAAYQDIVGRPGNAWKAWELRLPNSAEWLRADSLRTRLGAMAEVVAEHDKEEATTRNGLPALSPGQPEDETALKPATNVSALKLPTALELKEMSGRLKSHRDNLQFLLKDVQKITDEQWPVADPDYEGNLVERIAWMLKPIDIKTDGAKALVVDLTLARLIASLDDIIENFEPGKNQGKWAKQVLCSPEVAARTSEQNLKLPTAFGLKEVSYRFKMHRDNTQLLLTDVQKIADDRWPVADPYYQGNLAEQFASMLDPFDIETEGAKIMEMDSTLASLVVDLNGIIEDFDPGENQGEWAKEVNRSPGATV